jgi:hypothetical protein
MFWLQMEAKPAAVPLPGSERSGAEARVRGIATSTWTLGVAVFLLTWGGGLAAAFTPNVDVSFHAGLSMAATGSLEHGRDIVTTYGPLGFMKSYFAFEEWPARLAIVYGLALHLALSVSLVWALRRSFPLLVVVALALVVAAILRGDLSAIAVREDGAVVALAMIWAIAAIAPGAPRFARPLVLYGGGVFAAIELLAKLNTGLVVLALLAIATIAMDGDRRRNLAAFAGTLIAALAVLWFATGQGIGDVGPYVSRSLDVVSGYSSAARTEFAWEDRGYDYFLAPVILAGAVALAWVAGRGAPPLRRVAMFAALALVAFSAYKAGFVAHENWHMATFFGTMLGAYVAFPLPDGTATRLAGLAATAALAITTLISVGFDGYPMTDPVENVENAGGTIGALADPGDEIAANRERLMGQFALDEESRELLAGHTVHVDPSEAAAAWAYGLDWGPLPVFQPYGAWTTDLDELNAETLASPSGPERILRQRTAGYGRYPGFESPAAMVAMLCNFEPLRTTDTWQVLGRVPDRCGEPRPIATEGGAYGDAIPVPSAGPDEAIVARVDGVQVAGTERLRTFAARAHERTIRFGGGPVGGEDAPEWALVESTADDGLLISAPADADFPPPFALAPNAETLTFLRDGAAADGEITVEFSAVPVDAGGGR